MNDHIPLRLLVAYYAGEVDLSEEELAHLGGCDWCKMAEKAASRAKHEAAELERRRLEKANKATLGT